MKLIATGTCATTAVLELSGGPAKQSVLVRTGQRFLADRHIRDCPVRFDVLAIANVSRAAAGGSAAQGCFQPPSAALSAIFPADAMLYNIDNDPGAVAGILAASPRHNRGTIQATTPGYQSPEPGPEFSRGGVIA